jgi:hypothetical protein
MYGKGGGEITMTHCLSLQRPFVENWNKNSPRNDKGTIEVVYDMDARYQAQYRPYDPLKP